MRLLRQKEWRQPHAWDVAVFAYALDQRRQAAREFIVQLEPIAHRVLVAVVQLDQAERYALALRGETGEVAVDVGLAHRRVQLIPGAPPAQHAGLRAGAHVFGAL